MSSKLRDRIQLVRPEALIKKVEENEALSAPVMAPPMLRLAGMSDTQDQEGLGNGGSSVMKSESPDDRIGSVDAPNGQKTHKSSPEMQPSLGNAFSVTGASHDESGETENELTEEVQEQVSQLSASSLAASTADQTMSEHRESVNEKPEIKAPVEVQGAGQTEGESEMEAPEEVAPVSGPQAEDVMAETSAKAQAESEAAALTAEQSQSEKPQQELPVAGPQELGPSVPATANTETPAAKPQRRPSGISTGLPEDVRARMEQVFKVNLDSVKIMPNSGMPGAVGALALAKGNEIHFAPGQFSPNTPQGQSMLFHEMAHLTQQNGSAVQATTERMGLQVNEDASLERAADQMARQALAADLSEGISPDALVSLAGDTSLGVSQLMGNEGGGDAFAAYNEFLTWAQGKKGELREKTTTLKTQATEAGENQKQAIQNLVNTAIQTMTTALNGAVNKITTTTTAVREAINTHRQTKVDEITEIARTELEGIDQLIETKKTEVRQKGQTKADQLTTHAETQANRAITESTNNAAQVDSIISSTAAQYGDREGVNEAVSSANSNATSFKAEITSTGNEMARIVRSDAQGMGTDISSEADQVCAEFDKPKADANTKIEQKKAETITALEGTGTDFTTNLDTESQEVITALQQQIPQQEASMRSFAEGSNETIDKSVRDTHTVIDREMEKALADVDTFVQQIAEIGWHREEVQNAQNDLSSAIDGYNGEIDTFISESQGKYSEHQSQITQETNNLNTQIQTSVDGVTTDFDTQANAKKDEISGEMDTMTTTAGDEIKTVRTNMAPEFDNAIGEVEAKWDESVSTAESDITGKVDTGLEGQRSALSDFSGRINTEFANLPKKDRGILEAIWDGITDVASFIGGIFVGLFEALVDMVKGIIDIILTPAKWLMAAIVIIAAIIVIALVAFFAGISFGLAALIVGVVVGLIMAGYYIFQAITAEGLTPYERGKLVGRGLFEGITAFMGTGLLGRLGSWAGKISRLSAVVSKVGGIGNFLKMAAWVDDVERLISVINRVDDVGRLANIFGKLDNAADAAKVLDLIDNVGDASRILNFLGEGTNVSRLLSFIDDAGRFTSVMDKVGDAATLTRLMESGKISNLTALDGLLTHFDDVARMESMLGKVDDAAQLTTLIDRVGDVGKLDSLLSRTDNAAQLTSLLDEVGDADRLVRLLDRTGDAASAQRFLQQLKDMEQRLLSANLQRVDDGKGVIRYLDDTGREIAKMEDFTMTYSYGGHGGQIIMDPDRTTTILGKFQDPTTPGWGTEWVHNMPEGSFSRQGNNPGGVNMLDVDPKTWDDLLVEAGGDPALRNEIFWNRYNLPFLEQSFKNGDNIRLLSDPTNAATRTGTYLRELQAVEGPTGFAARYGYVFDAATQTYKRGPNWTGSPLSSVDNAAGAVDNVAASTDNLASTVDNAAANADNVSTTTDNAAGLLDENGRFKSGPGGAGWVDQPDSAAAARFYEEMERITDGSAALSISNNTGIDQSILSRVHSHLFAETHVVPMMNDAGQIITPSGKFTPFDSIAQLWRGGMDNTLTDTQKLQLRDLVAHEYIESRLMERGLPYRHTDSVEAGMPRPGDRFGAHDLSANDNYTNRVNGMQGYYTPEEIAAVTHFSHWEKFYGITYQGPALAHDLSNIDAVFEYIVRTLNL